MTGAETADFGSGCNGKLSRIVKGSGLGAVWMAEAGVVMDEIAQFLAHTDPRITYRVYARYSPEYLRKAASALDF